MPSTRKFHTDTTKSVNILFQSLVLQQRLQVDVAVSHLCFEYVFFSAALLASQVLPKIARGDLYQQVEWVIMETHSQLLDIIMKTQKNKQALIAQRCQRLSAFIKRSTVPEGSPDLMALQEKVSEK